MRSNNNPISNFFSFIRQSFGSGKEGDKVSKVKNIWRKLRIWVMLTFGITIFLILINQISFSEFLKILSKVNIAYLVAAFFIGISATIIKAIRFGFFFPAPGRWLGLYGVFAVLRVLYYLLPFNSGEIVYLTTLKKYRFTPSITETAPTWFFLRLTDIIALSVWFIIILFLIPFSGSLFGEMYSFRWIIIGMALALFVVISSFPFWIPRIRISESDNWLSQRLRLLQSGFRRTFKIATLIKTLTVSMIIWFVLILFDTFALLAFNTPLSFWECFLASTAIYSMSLLPINAPLNLGTDEALWTGVLMLAGVSASLAVSIALSIRIVSMLVLMTEGIVGFLLLVLRRDER